ncbi:hypothetical protein TNCV_2930811 [Trichonephila clavipes]|nr:hypothetical protein TNCV_2930811 [Trichonephila clavipes]
MTRTVTKSNPQVAEESDVNIHSFTYSTEVYRVEVLMHVKSAEAQSLPVGIEWNFGEFTTPALVAEGRLASIIFQMFPEEQCPGKTHKEIWIATYTGFPKARGNRA